LTRRKSRYNLAATEVAAELRTMKLSLETRDVGRVTIVRCKGRLVAGGEVESLRSHIAWLLRDRRSIVLHLGDVVFIDSSGIGTMVRTLTSTRQVRGDLKLCDVPEHVRKVLQLSHLTTLFDSHESEDHAIAAFYHAPVKAEQVVAQGRSVLCLGRNTDVLAYLRELLRRTGYDVHTTNNMRDGSLLMRVMNFDLLLVETGMTAAPGTEQAFQKACTKIPVIELGSDFSTLEAGDATVELLAKVAARLHPGTNHSS
jgi:anti-sigma B factor antagonist